MRALVQSGQLAESVFAFYLGSHGPGELVIGGVDQDHFSGSFVFVPLAAETYWEVHLERSRVGTKVDITDVVAIVDSGTSFLIDPKDEVSAIANAIGAFTFNGAYLSDCDSAGQPLFEDLVFTLNGHDFTVGGKDLALDFNPGSETCVLGLGASHDDLWILGNVFMRKYYVQFDWGNKRIGIANAVQAPDVLV